MYRIICDIIKPSFIGYKSPNYAIYSMQCLVFEKSIDF